MWVAKLKLKHDCTIGNRCEKFGVTSYSTSLGSYDKGKKNYTYQMHQIIGDAKKVGNFIADLRKDGRVKDLVVEGNTVMFVEERPAKRIPSSYYNKRLFFVKPVFVTMEGYEFWELASWDKKTLTDFIDGLEREGMKLEILKLSKAKVGDVYYPQIMPELTDNQKRAVELAVENGYYEIPRKIELKELAKMMGVSLPTFQEHLRKAEMKLMPNLSRKLK
ncbi:MAG: helix-turn-helix domain-containing protein [Candidatus Micrarchaeota archaeon]|nr:helix-turn-helix domain-containing protein [Candidatus Micrarchaeota archaeon]